MERLGLSELQAKIYLTLARLEKAEVKKIAQLSEVARQDIYRILPRLEELGLVEKIIATPTLYRAVPIREGATRLFQKQSDQHNELKNSLKSIANNWEENGASTILENNDEFIITSERKRFINRLEKSIYTTSICQIVCPGEGLNFIIFNLYDSFLSALSRGAEIRLITEETDLNKKTEQKIKDLTERPNFKIKFVPSLMNKAIVILDKEVNIRLSSSKAVPSLWTNNDQILKLTKIIFENEWNTN